MRKKKKSNRKPKSKEAGLRGPSPSRARPMAGNSSLQLLEQLLQPPPATRFAEHSLMMVTLTAKMCWSPQTAPGEDTGRQHCRMHRRKGAFERRRKKKSGKMSSRKQIFASAERPLPSSVLAAPPNPAASTCKTRPVWSELSQRHPLEEAARSGVCIAFKTRLGFLLTLC